LPRDAINAGSSDKTPLWHPFARMNDVATAEFVVDRAQGAWIWDQEGTRYFDATASLWYANVGHGRQRIADAIADQVIRLDAYSTFGDYTNNPARELAGRLAAVAPMDDARVFFGTGGGDGVETAIKLARFYWDVRGEPSRKHIVGRTGSYHGCFGFGTSVGGIAANRRGFEPLVPQTSDVAYDSVEALADEFERVGSSNVAAFICEPVIGAGGVLLPPDGYLKGVADLCSACGILFIADCVITGFGRLGEWFGIERWGVRPDLIVFAKGVTSGYLPLGGVVVSGSVAEPIWSAPDCVFAHGATYSGHPVCCAAALANLDILEEERLFERSRALEGELARVLDPLRADPRVTAVRAGVGMMAAVEFQPALWDAIPAIARSARNAGVIVRAVSSGGSIAVSPPLISDEEQLALIPAALGEAIEAVVGAVPRQRVASSPRTP
jgi:putrescine---pyruvate transaminase